MGNGWEMGGVRDYTFPLLIPLFIPRYISPSPPITQSTMLISQIKIKKT